MWNRRENITSTNRRHQSVWLHETVEKTMFLSFCRILLWRSQASTWFGVNAVLWPVKAVTRELRSLTFKCLKRRTTGSFRLARCCGLTLMTVTTTIMEFNLSPLELCVELDKMFSIPLRRATDIPTVSKKKQRKPGDATKTYTLRLSTSDKHLTLKSWFPALKSGLSW